MVIHLNSITLGEKFNLEDLPEGWDSCLMGDIANVIGGGTPKTSESSNFDESGHPWLTPADLSGFEGMYIQRGARSLSEKGLSTSSATMMPSGTVLMSSRAPIGYLAIAANPISTNQGFKSFVCSEGIGSEYAFYWLKYIRPILDSLGSGSTFSEISGSRAREIPLLVCPITEQNRIVAKVEELLARVTAARARLDRVPKIMKRFRQAVLAAACSGKLTEDWRDGHPEVEGAASFVESLQEERRSYLGRRYKTPELVDTGKLTEVPDSWMWGTLADLCLRIGDADHKMPHATSDGYPYISTKDFRGQDDIDFNSAKRISQDDFTIVTRKIKPSRGDILLSRYGTVGEIRKVRNEIEFQASYSIAIIKTLSVELFADYLTFILRSELLQEQMRRGIRASSQPDLGLETIRQFSIPVPPYEEQGEIVHCVETLFKLADTIEKRVEVAKIRADKLTQSILAKAFRGELIPTEAELARQEGRDYESASELLARIREKKAVAIPRARRSKRNG